MKIFTILENNINSVDNNKPFLLEKVIASSY